MAMFPLRSRCFVDAAADALNALEHAIDDATSQVTQCPSVHQSERANPPAEFAQVAWLVYCRARASRFTPSRCVQERRASGGG